MHNIAEDRRVIAKAKHENPATGKRCRGAVSTMISPTRGFTVAVGGEDLPVWDTTAKYRQGGSLGTPGFDAPSHEGWFYAIGRQEVRWAGICPGCGERKHLVGVPVKGKVNPAKTCDARCEGATGPNCECACGGENHGASHHG